MKLTMETVRGNNNLWEVESFPRSGTKIKKTITTNDLISAISKYKNRYNYSSSVKLNGILPKNVLSLNFDNTGNFAGLIYYEPQVYNWFHGDGKGVKSITVKMPALIYKFDSGGTINAYTLSGTDINDNTLISPLEFSNINNGSICFGTYKKKNIRRC